MPDIAESEVDAAMAELEKVRGELARRTGVTALDVGLRRIGDGLTDEVAIRVHVRKKLPLGELEEDEVLPTRLGRFPVDVIEASYEPEGTEARSVPATQRGTDG